MYFILPMGFTEQRRNDLVFSDSDQIRLDPADDKIKLKQELPFNDYPASANVRSPVRSPSLAKFYAGFEADVVLPSDTSIDYRLGDGTNVYYWDGGTWALATTDSHWSSEEDIADNIIFFNVDTIPGLDWPKITVTTRLQTTDLKVTPTLMEVRLLVDTLEFDMTEEILYGTLIPRLKTVEYSVPLKVKVITTGTTLDLTNFEIGLELDRIEDLEVAYNITDDPKEVNDIFSSYSSGTITFTETVTEDDVLLLMLKVSPQVSVSTHSDYKELAEFPAIIIERWEEDTLYHSGTPDGIINKEQGTVKFFKEVGPTASFSFDVACVSDHGKETQRLRGSVAKNLLNSALHNDGIDEDFPVRLRTSGLRFSGKSNLDNALTQKLEGGIDGIPLFLIDVEDGYIVKNLNLSIT